MHFLVRVTIACVIVSNGVSQTAAAPIVVDQQFVPTEFSLFANIGFSNNVDAAQTFTVGLAGKLSGLEVPVSRASSVTEPLLFDVRTVNDDLPTEPDAGQNILASLVIDAEDVPIIGSVNPPAPLYIDLRSFGIDATPGQSLAIVFRSDDPQPFCYLWGGELVEADYEGGRALSRLTAFGFDTWNVAFNEYQSDVAFRTFVEVPEPAALAIWAVSVAGPSTIRRHRGFRRLSAPA